jgi:hypothetical protein
VRSRARLRRRRDRRRENRPRAAQCDLTRISHRPSLPAPYGGPAVCGTRNACPISPRARPT